MIEVSKNDDEIIISPEHLVTVYFALIDSSIYCGNKLKEYRDKKFEDLSPNDMYMIKCWVEHQMKCEKLIKKFEKILKDNKYMLDEIKINNK